MKKKDFMRLSCLFIIATACASTAQAQTWLEPQIAIPDGQQLVATSRVSWHKDYKRGKHIPSAEETIQYDEQGRETIHNYYDYIGYKKLGENHYEQIELDEPHLYLATHTFYDESGKVKCVTNHRHYAEEDIWFDNFDLYTEFDETTGLPTCIVRYNGVYGETEEDELSVVGKWVIKSYHGDKPQDFEYWTLSWPSEEFVISYQYTREFNEWGGIAKQTHVSQWSTFEESFEYDEHHNVVKEVMEYSDSEPGIRTYNNDYDDNGLLLTVTDVPPHEDVFWEMTTFTWQETGEPSAILRTQASDSSRKWTTLSGQQLARRPAKPGLYITNGKKYVIK